MTKEKTKKIDPKDIYDKEKSYKIAEAIKILKQVNRAKFDASVELHFRLGIDPKKGDQQIRGAVNLPHGTGKTIKIAAFVLPENEKAVKEAGADLVGGEDLIEEIKKTNKTDFKVAIAETAMMKDLAKIAKILGTRGLMPSLKNETVTNNPAKTVAELKKGKISFKNDDTANLHLIIGKISFADEKLAENFQTILNEIKKIKPPAAKGVFLKSVNLCSSISPAIKVSVE